MYYLFNILSNNVIVIFSDALERTAINWEIHTNFNGSSLLGSMRKSAQRSLSAPKEQARKCLKNSLVRAVLNGRRDEIVESGCPAMVNSRRRARRSRGRWFVRFRHWMIVGGRKLIRREAWVSLVAYGGPTAHSIMRRLDGLRVSHVVLCKTRPIVGSTLLSLNGRASRVKGSVGKADVWPLRLVIFQTLSGYSREDVDWWQIRSRIKDSSAPLPLLPP